MEGAKSLKDYLKRYESDNVDEEKLKKKKKKKKKGRGETAGAGAGAGALCVVDEDPVWQKPVNLAEEEDDDSADEVPQVDEDIEVKRMKRLEQLRARRPFHSIAEDGSGWISLPPDGSDSVDQNSDISPPRRHRARNDTPSPEPKPKSARDTPSPELRQSRRLNSESGPDGDMSPPRRRRARHDTPPPNPNKSHPDLGKEDDDISPPRQRRKNDRGQSPDVSPPEPSDLSPPRRGRRGSQNVDLSPPRRRREDGGADIVRASSISDLSPPRKHKKDSVPVGSKERRKGGLISAKDTGKEIAKSKEEERSRFQAMDPSLTGKGAEPVHRDKLTGRRLSKEELLKSKEEEKPKEVKLEWGKGLAQKREAEERLQELELEKEKPFARTRDDPELDKMLKERVRWGDPMAHLVKSKYSEPILADLGDNEKMKESGFIIPQGVPNHSWLKRGSAPAPNRYGIRPGRHWDGVDRSTGFENQMFKRKNEKQATEREAYLWSVSDM